MEKLERESEKILVLGFIFAIAFHASLGSYFMFKKTEVRVVRPPSFEFVIKRPRMTKPFAFKKQRIKQREYKKKDIIDRNPAADIETKSLSTHFSGTVVSYELDSKMDNEIEEAPVIRKGIDIRLTTKREPANQISLKDEMITLDDLDTGQFKAMVIQDPGNKQNVQGFVYIATIWGAMFEPAYRRGVIHLSDAINRYTNINSKVDNHLFIDSKRIFDVPFVYLCVTKAFELNEVEIRNFRDYLKKGGFAVLDNGTPSNEFGAAEASLRRMLQDTAGSVLPIRNDHPIYHCFFDFDDGPPQGVEHSVVSVSSQRNFRQSQSYSLAKQVFFLEGVEVDNRLVAIYSDKGYGIKWSNNSDNEPQLKIGINMVVFALTQEGSISQQKIDLFLTRK